MRILEERLADAQARRSSLGERNERWSRPCAEARDQVRRAEEEIDRLAQTAQRLRVFLEAFEDGTVDIFTGGRKLRVAVSPEVATVRVAARQEVMLKRGR